MIRNLILCLAVLLVTGCRPAPQEAAAVFKWATVDANKIRKIISDNMREENPNPVSLDKIADSARTERQSLQQQISGIENAERAKCRRLVSPEEKEVRNSARASIYAAQERLMTPIRFENERALEENRQYQDCVANIGNDQLVVDLRNKLFKLDESFREARKQDEMVAQKAEKAANQVVAEYAERHGYDLIMINQQSSAIVYNKNKAVVDVTADVIDFMSTDKVSPGQ